jgi:hypothetical protein
MRERRALAGEFGVMKLGPKMLGWVVIPLIGECSMSLACACRTH